MRHRLSIGEGAQYDVPTFYQPPTQPADSPVRHVVAKLTNPSSRAGEWVFNPSNRSYSPLTSNQSGQGFTAHLLGDVTGNWPNGAAQVNAVQAAACAGLTPVTATQGEPFSLPLRVRDVPEGEVLAYQFDVEYDPALLSYAGLAQAGTLSEGWSVDDNDATTGRLRVGGYSSNALASEGTLLNLRFTVLTAATGEQAPVLAAFQFNEGQPGYRSCAAANAVYLPLISK